jgi:hypothetical protein
MGRLYRRTAAMASRNPYSASPALPNLSQPSFAGKKDAIHSVRKT